MKTFLFFIACLLATPTFAQDNHDAPEEPKPAAHNAYIGNELILSHGFLPGGQAFGNNSRYYYVNYNNETYSGAIGLTYRYHLSRVISLGVSAVYNHEQGNWSQDGMFYSTGYNPGPFYGSYYGTFKRNSFTVAPEIIFNYCHLGHGLVNMYSVVGMGYTYTSEKRLDNGGSSVTDFDINPLQFNMYLSPFGIRFGRQLSGFFELGVGYKGVISYGLTYRF